MDLENDIEGDDLHAIEIIQVGVPRQVNVRNDHFNRFSELEFFKRFRLTKDTVMALLLQIEDHLEYPLDNNNCVSPINQLLMALRFFATGNHLQGVADFGGVHVSTVCRIIKRVSEAISRLAHLYIRLPGNEAERTSIQRKFFNIAAFPKVLGAVDGTHIRIQSPGGNDAEVFRNRKDYFSINVQVVSDADKKIIDIVARWPGSAHDATIFNSSAIKRRFDNGTFDNLLLGDSAYPIRPYMMTPLLAPHTPAEQRYNESQIRSRVVVENLFGIWKRRFPVLAYGCRLKLQKTLTVIVATAVLHNIAREMGEDEPEIEGDPQVLEQLIADGQIPNIAAADGPRNVRDLFIANYFGNM